MRKSERRELIQLLDKLMAHEECVIDSHIIAVGVGAEKNADDEDVLLEARSTWTRANRIAIRLERRAKPGKVQTGPAVKYGG